MLRTVSMTCRELIVALVREELDLSATTNKESHAPQLDQQLVGQAPSDKHYGLLNTILIRVSLPVSKEDVPSAPDPFVHHVIAVEPGLSTRNEINREKPRPEVGRDRFGFDDYAKMIECYQRPTHMPRMGHEKYAIDTRSL